MSVVAHRSFPASPAALGEIRRFVRDALRTSIDEPTREELNLAVSEAGANSILHSGADHVEVTIAVVDGAIEVAVSDDGVFRPDPAETGGFGFRIMAATVDEMRISRGTERSPGTSVCLVKRLAS